MPRQKADDVVLDARSSQGRGCEVAEVVDAEGRRIGSGSLMADAWNDAVDILSATAALCALGLTLYDPARFLAADHYGGFAGLFVIYTGLRVLRETSLDLIDTMPPPKWVGRIRAATLEVDGVKGVEKCYARKMGLPHYVDLHVEVDPESQLQNRTKLP